MTFTVTRVLDWFKDIQTLNIFCILHLLGLYIVGISTDPQMQYKSFALLGLLKIRKCQS